MYFTLSAKLAWARTGAGIPKETIGFSYSADGKTFTGIGSATTSSSGLASRIVKLPRKPPQGYLFRAAFGGDEKIGAQASIVETKDPPGNYSWFQVLIDEIWQLFGLPLPYLAITVQL